MLGLGRKLLARPSPLSPWPSFTVHPIPPEKPVLALKGFSCFCPQYLIPGSHVCFPSSPASIFASFLLSRASFSWRSLVLILSSVDDRPAFRECFRMFRDAGRAFSPLLFWSSPACYLKLDTGMFVHSSLKMYALRSLFAPPEHLNVTPHVCTAPRLPLWLVARGQAHQPRPQASRHV